MAFGTETESDREYTQDILLGLTFAAIAFLSGWRTILYFELVGSGKVISAFYFLIFLTGFFRCIWFLVPSSVLGCTYSPQPVFAFQTICWRGFFMSEVLSSLGSLFLYSIFLLLVTFWAHMLNKVDSNNNDMDDDTTPQKPRQGPLAKFLFVMFVIFFIEMLNFSCFFIDLYNSEVMIIIDSIIFSIVSLSVLIGITIFSSKIRVVLSTIGSINANSTKSQTQRILAVTVAANMFLCIHIIAEVYSTIYIFRQLQEKNTITFSRGHHGWDMYIAVKYWSESCVLALILIISTSVQSDIPKSGGQPQQHKENTISKSRKKRNKKNQKTYSQMLTTEAELIPLTAKNTPTIYHV